VTVFIRREERQLSEAFGEQYRSYRSRVDRLVPFRKP
jgi:protein-S-isoprenylcysteine O-methyltransferase Ste14